MTNWPIKILVIFVAVAVVQQLVFAALDQILFIDALLFAVTHGCYS